MSEIDELEEKKKIYTVFRALTVRKIKELSRGQQVKKT